MRILTIDTSSRHGSVAVLDGEDVAGEIRLASSIQHSDRLFHSLEFLFKYVGFGPCDVDLFVAARGPGSFTGLRIGLAACQGFAAGCKKPGRGIPTLRAVAWMHRRAAPLLAPMLDARRGEIYGALYRWDGADLIEERAPAVLQPTRWLAGLPRVPMLFCGDGVLRSRDGIDTASGWEFDTRPCYLAVPMAEMAALGYTDTLDPMYVRQPDAKPSGGLRNESDRSQGSTCTA